MQAELRLPIPANALVTSSGQSMARAEALLPHPAAARIPIDLSKGEPWSDHQTEHPNRVRFEVMAAGFRLLPFFFTEQSNINRR